MFKLRAFSAISVITFLVLQPIFTTPTFAAGFQINEISPGLQGDATAGAAAARNDVSAMFINPATLGSLIQKQAYIGASGIFPHIDMSSASAIHTVNIPGLPPSNITAPVIGEDSQDDVAKDAFVPDLYLGWRINNKFALGISILAPFGLVTEYDDDSVVRFAAQKSSVKTVNITPALAFNYNEKLSFGIGFQAQYMQAILSNFDGPYTGMPPIDALIASTEPTHLTAHGWGFGYTLGATFAPDPKTHIGLSYRSMIHNDLDGNGQQFTSPGGIVPAPSPDFLFNAQTHVSSTIKTPAIATFGVTRDINSWTIKATAQVNFWNTLNHISIDMPDAFATNSTIETKWDNAWFAALGADYLVNSVWTVRGGFAFDQTPTKDETRDPRIPDSDRYWLTVGTSYTISKHTSIDAAYAHIFSPNQTVDVTQASGSNAIDPGPLEVNQVNAHYHNSVDIVALALRVNF